MTSSNGNIFRITGHLCGEFTGHLVTRSFDLFFDLLLNTRLSKQSWGWWFETPSLPLWRHCNEPTSQPCQLPPSSQERGPRCLPPCQKVHLCQKQINTYDNNDDNYDNDNGDGNHSNNNDHNDKDKDHSDDNEKILLLIIIMIMIMVIRIQKAIQRTPLFHDLTLNNG